MLIKQEAVKQWSKKRKESGSDEKDDGSKGSSTPPPAKKSKVTDATKKSSSLNVDSSKPPSIFGDGTPVKKAKEIDDGSTTEENTPEDDKVEDSIIVQVKGDAPPVKKVTGDPFGQVRDAHKAQKVATGASTSPSPAPKPERKLAAKPSVKDATNLKFNVTAPGHSQGAERAQKPSDFPPRAKGPAKVAPSTKVANAKNLVDEISTSSNQNVAKTVESTKNAGFQGKVGYNNSGLAVRREKVKENSATPQVVAINPAQEPKSEKQGSLLGSNNTTQLSGGPAQDRVMGGMVEADIGKLKLELVEDATNAVGYFKDLPSLPSSAVSGVSAAHQEEVSDEAMGRRSFIVGLQSAAATHAAEPLDSIEHILGAVVNAGPNLQPPTFDMAGANGRSVDIAEDAFTGEDTDLLKQDDAVEGFINGGRDMNISDRTVTPAARNSSGPSTYTNSVLPLTPAASTANNQDTAATASPFPPTPQSCVFIITICPQPDNSNTDTESTCLTFPMSTTWSSFYGRVALELAAGDNAGDKAAFTAASKCKVKVPGQDQGKPRVFRFGIMPPAAESIWANVMRMVAGVGEGGEAVEVTFFA